MHKVPAVRTQGLIEQRYVKLEERKKNLKIEISKE